jgi:hypothetical protein
VRLRLSTETPRVLEWRLVLGTSITAGDVLDSGFQSGEFLDVDAATLTNARFARLWYRRGSVWTFEDFPWPA